ncbi:DUF3943 domain-containing protein, partial [bacterium BMS3Abin03]|nr:DUF3943 domain-containing protein [bacterium BMS3Abin03]
MNNSIQFISKIFFTAFFVLVICISVGLGQTGETQNPGPNQMRLFNNYLLSSNSLLRSNSSKSLKSLVYKKSYNNKWGTVSVPPKLTDDNFKPWESEKHFWVGAGEIAILEFIPWALARWIRHWENPADNWAKVSFDTWWRNISHGWEYDGDNFETNNFAHPYHGALFFNAGRTNGYDFWEST